MARYAIGDIQGCFKQFKNLLDVIDFNPGGDTLYLVGDLVNRGADSLKVIEWVYKNQEQVILVLGNHDIYLLARYNNLVKKDSDDTLDELLNNKSIAKYIDFLRSNPLIFHDNQYILTHAGLYPLLDFNLSLQLNFAISRHLMSSDYSLFLKHVYGNKPNLWQTNLNLLDQMKFFLNASTRMRLLNKNDYSLDYKYKSHLHKVPKELIPWFSAPRHPSIQKTIIFGHWAALGFFQDSKHISLDTGCVWGRKLSAINLETHELYQV